MLAKFWDLANDVYLFIGHNIIDFDMRFIVQRSVVNGVRPSWDERDLSFARYRSAPMFDTMREWTKWSMNNVGLEHLALALGIPSPKDGIDGSQVYDFWKKGKVKEILEYCKRDVETTREVYKKIAFLN
jgi:predicted PolB exonuclease-like 3'-5' exonuclease